MIEPILSNHPTPIQNILDFEDNKSYRAWLHFSHVSGLHLRLKFWSQCNNRPGRSFLIQVQSKIIIFLLNARFYSIYLVIHVLLHMKRKPKWCIILWFYKELFYQISSLYSWNWFSTPKRICLGWKLCYKWYFSRISGFLIFSGGSTFGKKSKDLRL